MDATDIKDRIRRQLTEELVTYLTPKGGPAGYRLQYGVGVDDVSPDGTEVFARLVFRAGHRYCCLEPGCHHGLLFDSDYERLRTCFRQAGADIGAPMKLHLRVICESGTQCAIDPGASRAQYRVVEAGWEKYDVCDEATAYKKGELPRTE